MTNTQAATAIEMMADADSNRLNSIMTKLAARLVGPATPDRRAAQAIQALERGHAGAYELAASAEADAQWLYSSHARTDLQILRTQQEVNTYAAIKFAARGRKSAQVVHEFVYHAAAAMASAAVLKYGGSWDEQLDQIRGFLVSEIQTALLSDWGGLRAALLPFS
jgi:hypothetical protein